MSYPSKSPQALNAIVLMLAACGLGGCSVDVETFSALPTAASSADSGTEMMALIAPEAAADMDEPEAMEAAEPSDEGPLEVASLPFPDRKNPFEFAAGVTFENSGEQIAQEAELKLYGFVGSDFPKAIIHLGDKTKILAAGEKWGALEVVEVTPPSVRIKSNGVMRVWSILGQSVDATN